MGCQVQLARPAGGPAPRSAARLTTHSKTAPRRASGTTTSTWGPFAVPLSGCSRGARLPPLPAPLAAPLGRLRLLKRARNSRMKGLRCEFSGCRTTASGNVQCCVFPSLHTHCGTPKCARNERVVAAYTAGSTRIRRRAPRPHLSYRRRLYRDKVLLAFTFLIVVAIVGISIYAALNPKKNLFAAAPAVATPPLSPASSAAL